MSSARPAWLDRPIDFGRDHVLGSAAADITLVEYGSYACPSCKAAHDVVVALRDRFGERVCYVYRHRPLALEDARRAAEIAEQVSAVTGDFWHVHDALMKRGPVFAPGDLDALCSEFGGSARDDAHAEDWRAAAARVREDAQSAASSGALVTPSFFINGRRYEGAWDEAALSEAMLGSLGHRLHTATLDFARWAPSTGLMLLLMSLAAIAIVNTPFGPAFEAWWHTPLGLRLGSGGYALPLIDWVNHGLLSIFFLVVGLEIKREFTVGRLATRRAAALPVCAALGGMIAPALIYLLVIDSAALAHGWGMTIATDTAFAIALIALLGDRVPVELRVFLTAAVIVDDLVAIAVVALFYSGAMDLHYLAASVVVTLAVLAFNRAGVYRALPYAVGGAVLWVCLHEAGLHATLAGVVLALLIPTRPPPNLHALMAQAQTVFEAEAQRPGASVMRHGLSEPALNAIDAIHDRIESPADKMLRHVEPWSSYVVLPVFALANAGVALSIDVLQGHGNLMLAIVLGLVVGKPVGIALAAWLAVRFRIAAKPDAYTWRQLAGAGALAGIGFTMSLFIAGQAFPGASEFAAAKISIFIASLLAGVAGVSLLWRHKHHTVI
jgi:NhaA family Na+:H+ antiporter